MALHFPKWLNDLPEIGREDARRRFVLRSAALHYHPDGHLKTLSTGIGLAENTLATYLSANQPITADIAVRLEEVLGRSCFPREIFRPDLFLTPEA